MYKTLAHNMTDISELAAKGDALDLAIAEARGEVIVTRLRRKNAPRPRVMREKNV